MNDLVQNKKAFHHFEILEIFEAGIALQGTEIKSLKAHGGSLQDAYVDVSHDELWLINSYIAPYSFGNIYNHEERRKRKLLMHKREIAKLKKQVTEKGLTIVPLSIYLKKGMAKVKIALAKGKKSHDKRAAIKEREHKKDIARHLVK